MKILFYDTHQFEIDFYKQNSLNLFEIDFLNFRLNENTVKLADGYTAISIFVNDNANRAVIEKLSKLGVKLIALRCAGFNNVDMNACKEFGLQVVRVPEYSPHAVAEHALALLMTLNRKIHKSYNRVKESNFSLDGLVGFDIFNKSVGVIGTGKIGQAFAQIMLGLGCRVLAYDLNENTELKNKGATYTTLNQIFELSDIISLHIPLLPETQYIINEDSISKMKKNCIIINTGRGALIKTSALVNALKKQKIGGACLDVYEEENGIFFENLSEKIIQDDTLVRLIHFPNVIITSHQGFLTTEALQNIATTTLTSFQEYQNKTNLTYKIN